MTEWIAVDWGTSNLRVWGMRGDASLWEATTPDGMAMLAPDGFERTLLAAIGDRIDGPTDVVVCGMAGSRQGWVEAPYRPVPCAPQGGPAAVPPTTDPRLRVRILPGLCQLDPPDVMRGEEAQVAGLLAADPDYDGAICLPGTHSKWVHVSAGEVVSFCTALTGEFFSLLKQSTLRHSLGAWEEAPFLDAVSETLSRPERILTDLFRIRAAHLLQEDETGGSRLSGLLVGAELAATRAWWLGRPVALVGAERLTAIYAAALGAQGVPIAKHDATATTLRGLLAARQAMIP